MELKDKINKVNTDFYSTIADSFSQTRQYAWHGWDKLQVYLQKEANLNVLDLGCGNGRFAHFLAEKDIKNIKYTGIDSCVELTELGQEQISKKQCDNLSVIFHNQNILTELTIDNQQKYDIITLFGVMHHIYDNTDRNNLFSSISSKLSTDGYFIFATWEFKNNQRQMNKHLDLNSEKGKEFLNKYELDVKDFGSEDYILDWTRINQAYRYCRNYSKEEIEKLCKENSLQIVDSYYADGKEGNVNKYYICKILT